jgi:hypothetical protein
VICLHLKAFASGAQPQIRVEPARLRFTAANRSQYITIRNNGEGILFVKKIDFGADNPPFNISSTQLVVPPHSSRPVKVSFNGDDARRYQSQICIVSNDRAVGTTNKCGVLRTVGDGMTLPRNAVEISISGGRW